MHKHRYARYWCEENIWHLCRERLDEPEATRPTAIRVLVVSNLEHACALWQQRAAPAPSLPVLWDYHVLMLCREPSIQGGQGGPEGQGSRGGQGGWSVWDLDTTIGLPVAIDDYLRGTFLRRHGAHAPLFRVFDGADYVRVLSSDRSHMRRPDGSWTEPPPPWPPILAGESNLMRLIDMREKTPGEVMTLGELERRFARPVTSRR